MKLCVAPTPDRVNRLDSQTFPPEPVDRTVNDASNQNSNPTLVPNVAAGNVSVLVLDPFNPGPTANVCGPELAQVPQPDPFRMYFVPA